jgi:hypothetical protein
MLIALDAKVGREKVVGRSPSEAQVRVGTKTSLI